MLGVYAFDKAIRNKTRKRKILREVAPKELLKMAQSTMTQKNPIDAILSFI